MLPLLLLALARPCWMLSASRWLPLLRFYRSVGSTRPTRHCSLLGHRPAAAAAVGLPLHRHRLPSLFDLAQFD
uniref:Putative secreted protein n=1 Tax=Anopheles triannulatus TaxID=58253 RepID=A0A2M4B1Z6_9DIPT